MIQYTWRRWRKCKFPVVLILMSLSLAFMDSTFNTQYQQITMKFSIEETEGVRKERVVDNVNGCYKLLKVDFDAFDRHFTLQLSCDNKIFTPGLIVNVVGSERYNDSMLNYVSIYTGYLQGDPSSYIMGSINHKIFDCTIYTTNRTYNIEKKQTERKPAVITYVVAKRELLVNRTSNITDSEIHQKLKSLRAERLLIKKQIEFSRRKYDSGKNPNSTRKTQWKRAFPDSKICLLHLVADHTFVAAFNGGVKSALSEMIHHVVIADTIFRSTDFNGDGIGDNIGFSIANITIFEDPLADNLLAGSYISADEYLTAFTRLDFSSYCLGFGFTYRDFSNGVLGLAWLGFSGQYSPAGGICASRVHYKGSGMLSLNTGIITLNNYGRRQPREVTTLTMAHELAHSFGSAHDPATIQCSPGGKLGNFIMSSVATSGNKAHNSQFSPCSKQAIAPVILTKGTCLISSNTGWCGNGLVEKGEECDCGGLLQCDDIDPCCTPSGGLGSDPGCTIRRDLGYICSPLVSSCCTTDCQVVSETTNLVCRAYSECKLPSRCSGFSSECPPTDILMNGSSCDHGTKRCLSGQCVVSICKDMGLQECTCENQIDMCQICCEAANGCLAASTLGLFHQNGDLLLKPAGRACNNYTGYCDKSGACIMIDSDSALNRLKELFTNQGDTSLLQWIIENWYYGFVLILSLCTVALLIRILACQPRRPIRTQTNKNNLRKQPTKIIKKPEENKTAFQASLLLQIFPSLDEVLLRDIVSNNKCLCDSIKELIKLKQPLIKINMSHIVSDLQCVLEEDLINI